MHVRIKCANVGTLIHMNFNFKYSMNGFSFLWKIQEDNSWMVETYNHIPFQMGILKEILFMSICFACLHFVSLSDPRSFKCCYCLLLLFMRITPSLTVSINCETLWFATVYLQLYQKYIQSDGNMNLSETREYSSHSEYFNWLNLCVTLLTIGIAL